MAKVIDPGRGQPRAKMTYSDDEFECGFCLGWMTR